MKYKLKVYSIYELGQRSNQEDNMFPKHQQATDDDRLFIVCDGMGGHSAGEVASSLVCEAMSRSVMTACPDVEGAFSDTDLKDALEDAYDALDQNDNGAVKKMGTTMTFLKFHRDGATIAHIGDSRVYHIRPSSDMESTRILFQTSDHSLVNDLVKIGELTPEEAKVSKQKNVITRAMQPSLERRPSADIHHVSDIRPGDCFFMCTDGILENMEDDDVCSIFSDKTGDDQTKVEAIIKHTEGNRDNHSAYLIRVEEVEQTPVITSPVPQVEPMPMPAEVYVDMSDKPSYDIEDDDKLKKSRLLNKAVILIAVLVFGVALYMLVSGGFKSEDDVVVKPADKANVSKSQTEAEQAKSDAQQYASLMEMGAEFEENYATLQKAKEKYSSAKELEEKWSQSKDYGSLFSQDAAGALKRVENKLKELEEAESKTKAAEEQFNDDLTRYNDLISSADKLCDKGDESSLKTAIDKYKSAAEIESRYEHLEYSDRFNRAAFASVVLAEKRLSDVQAAEKEFNKDLKTYNDLISSADKLCDKGDESSLKSAIAKYKSASEIESRYKRTEYSDRFNRAASASASRAEKRLSDVLVALKYASLTGSHNGHAWVDLGLSVKWATCNVGASRPGDYGNYYAWGETTTKSTYTEDNSASYESSDLKWNYIGGNSRYDAATANWGGDWRLPTKAEFEELLNNCTWEWTTLNGHNGYKVTSKKNGQSIFLPAAGWRLGADEGGVGSDGGYWGSTPDESTAYGAYDLYFLEGYHDVGRHYRSHGHSVRPVLE